MLTTMTMLLIGANVLVLGLSAMRTPALSRRWWVAGLGLLLLLHLLLPRGWVVASFFAAPPGEAANFANTIQNLFSSTSGLYWAMYFLEMDLMDEKFEFKPNAMTEDDSWGLLTDFDEGGEDWSWLQH